MSQRRDALKTWMLRAAHSGPTLMELFLAVTAIRWGIYTIIPADWIENTRGETIRQMSTMAPLPLWAGIFLALGLLQAYEAVGVNQRRRKLLHLFGAIWWFIVTAIDWTTGFSSATINILQFSLFSWLTFFFLAVVFEPDAPRGL